MDDPPRSGIEFPMGIKRYSDEKSVYLPYPQGRDLEIMETLTSVSPSDEMCRGGSQTLN